jgi:hypothetical protein
LGDWGRSILPTLRRDTGASGLGAGAFGNFGSFALSLPTGGGFVGLLFAILFYIFFSEFHVRRCHAIQESIKKQGAI